MVNPSERSRIKLCGRLSVELDGVELTAALRGKQVPLLLAYLVLSRRRPVGRDELIGALWSDRAPRSQDAALRTLLSRLRSALGPSVLIGRDELTLELPEPAWVDVEVAGAEVGRAQRALQRGDARSAWALAQLPLDIAGRALLPGINASWLEPPRRELSDIRLRALEVIGRAGLGLGAARAGSVERAARALIAAEPYRESGYMLLMEALQEQGNLAEGLRVFDGLRTLLREELGTAPSPGAISLHERLLQPGGPRATGSDANLGIELQAELRQPSPAPLVGRGRELAGIQRWLAQGDPGGAGEGRTGRVMLLSGDPGIGKTSLLAEIARRAHLGGMLVLAGRAGEETLVPFQPFLEALGHYVALASLEQLRATVRTDAGELARLLPELRRRLPQLPQVGPGESETERYRLFEAVVGLLCELCASTPVLIILDDLHWADRPTLLLLRHLARAPKAAGLSILGAYRASERWHEGFETALSGLRRDRLMSQMDIDGLPERDATELLGSRIGGTPSLEFSRALYAETEGNPFFIEEIVRHLTDSGVGAEGVSARDLQRFGLPEDVKALISRRLARLDTDAVEWLRVAAVIGRDFEAALLERVLAFDEDRFLGGLDAALTAGLIAESPSDPGRYGFSHTLIRETLYEGMSSQRRTRIHRRVGTALESAGAERHLSALAHHFTRAAGPQDVDRAIDYALRAGEQATLMLAHEEAVDHYARALEVLERFVPDAQARRLALLLALGEAQVRSGERPQARTIFREAAALAAPLGDSSSLARAAIGASRRYIQPPGVIDEELIGLLDQALAMTRAERTATRVRLLGRLCGAIYFSPRREEMKALSAEASQIAAELGDPEAKALAAAARRRAYWDPLNLRRRRADSTELLRFAREAGDTELALQGQAWLIVDLLEGGEHPAAVDAQIDAFAQGAEQLRQPLYLWNAAVWRAMRALLAGQLERADALALAALQSGMRSEGITAAQYYATQLLGIRREQRRMGELEQAVRGLVAQNPHRPAWRAGLAMLLGETGRRQAAAGELDLLAAQRFIDIPRDVDWMITLTLLADLAVELGDADRAQLLYDLLAPYREANVVIGVAAVCLGATSRYLGRLATTTGRRADADRHLQHALRANTALKAPILLAHTQLDYALTLGPGAQARALIEAAQRTAQAMGLPAVRRRAKRLQQA